jgi:very-short-patch-repair endonuclease
LTPLPDGEVDVTLIGRDAAPRPEVSAYRVPSLDARDVGVRRGIPVTAPARTVIDLAAQSDGGLVSRAIAEAQVLRLFTERELDQALERSPNRAGSAFVRKATTTGRVTALTRSEAERRLLQLIDQSRLPRPETNARLLGYEVDLLWRRERLVVEVDGHAFHGHRAAFERDRARDQELVAAGYRVIRVTWRQLEHEPLVVVARIAQALGGLAPSA